MRRYCVALMLLCPLLCIGQAAIGQELETITVTAQKRPQPLQDVPISMHVTEGHTLRERAYVRLEDFSSILRGRHHSRHFTGEASIYSRYIHSRF